MLNCKCLKIKTHFMANIHVVYPLKAPKNILFAGFLRGIGQKWVNSQREKNIRHYRASVFW